MHQEPAECEIELQMAESDVKNVARLSRTEVFNRPKSEEFVKQVRKTIHEQYIDHEMGFTDVFSFSTTSEYVRAVVFDIEESDLRVCPFRTFLRMNFAAMFAESHVESLSDSIPDSVSIESVTELYVKTANRLQKNNKNPELKLKSLHYNTDFSESQGYSIGRAIGRTHTPDWSDAYLYMLLTPATNDPVNCLYDTE